MDKPINNGAKDDLREIFGEIVVSPLEGKIGEIASQTKGFDEIKEQLKGLPGCIEGQIDYIIEEAVSSIKDAIDESSSDQLKKMDSDEGGIARRCSDSINSVRQALAEQINGLDDRMGVSMSTLSFISDQLKKMDSDEDGIAQKCSDSINSVRQALAEQITDQGISMEASKSTLASMLDDLSAQTADAKTAIEDRVTLLESGISDRLTLVEKRNKTLQYLMVAIGSICLISMITQIFFLLSH